MPLFHSTHTLPTAWKKLYGLHAFEREEPWAAAKDLCFWEGTSSSMDCAFDRNSGAPWIRNLSSVDCTWAPWNVLELHGLQFWQKLEFLGLYFELHGLFLSFMDCAFQLQGFETECIEAKLWSVIYHKEKDQSRAIIITTTTHFLAKNLLKQQLQTVCVQAKSFLPIQLKNLTLLGSHSHSHPSFAEVVLSIRRNPMSTAEHEPSGSHVHCFAAKQKNLQTNYVGYF